MPPTVILIRHAQALHNVNHKYHPTEKHKTPRTTANTPSQDYSIHDPELSALGRTQCAELSQNLKHALPAAGLDDVGLILTSAMRRTCETAILSLGFLIEQGVPLQAHAGWQENSAKPCDTGSPLAAVAQEFPLVDFSAVDPVYPDKTSRPAGDRYRYTKAALLARARDVLAELYHRPEKAVVVVSHSGFLRQCVTGDHYFNADYRVYDFEERKEGEEGPFRLKQRELTKGAGGVGRSYDEVVEIGISLPEEELPPGEDIPLPEGVKPN